MEGIIQDNGTVLGNDGNIYQLEFRGTNEVLIDAKAIDGRGSFQRQSYIPLIGYKVKFAISASNYGYNFEIINENK